MVIACDGSKVLFKPFSVHHKEAWQKNTSAVLSSQNRLAMHVNQFCTMAKSRLEYSKPLVALKSPAYQAQEHLPDMTDW